MFEIEKSSAVLLAPKTDSKKMIMNGETNRLSNVWGENWVLENDGRKFLIYFFEILYTYIAKLEYLYFERKNM